MKRRKATSSTKAGFGHHLRKTRESKHLTPESVGRSLKFDVKYVHIFETDSYEDIEHNIYVRGYFASYVEHLELNVDDFLANYDRARGEIGDESGIHKPQKLSKSIVTSKLLVGLIGALLIGGVLVYVGMQLFVLSSAPKLELTDPATDTTVESSAIIFRGETGAGSELFINGEPVLLDERGGFMHEVALQDGLNTIEVVSRNKLNKEAKIIRNIIARLDNTEAD